MRNAGSETVRARYGFVYLNRRNQSPKFRASTAKQSIEAALKEQGQNKRDVYITDRPLAFMTTFGLSHHETES